MELIIVANFDPDGNLERLHLNPKEQCNLDDAEDTQRLSWAELLTMAGGEDHEDTQNFWESHFCQYCGFSA